MKDPVECVVEELRADFQRLAEARNATLGASAQMEAATRVLLQYEARRMVAKLGPEHPRTLRLKARLTAAEGIARDIEVDRQRYRVKVPDVTSEGALVHGRLVDEQGRGIGGLTVCLLDAAATPLREIPDATTDDSGYFAHPLDPELLETLLETKEAGLFLGVFAPRGATVHRGRKPLALDRGAHLFSEITLDRHLVAERNRTWTEEEETEPKVTVPDLAGLSETEASAVLKRVRLNLGERTTKHAPDLAGRILDQAPPAKKVVPVGTSVDVVVGIAEDADIEVPRVTGIKLSSARSKLSRYDLKLGEVEYRRSEEDDVVLEQQPEEGRRVPPGTPVKIVVGTKEG